MKKLILLLLTSLFLFSCASDTPPVCKEKGICPREQIGGITIGGVYGERPDFSSTLKQFLKNNNSE